ncbi:protein cholesin isoform X2 [Dendropsophus ebraccatus]
MGKNKTTSGKREKKKQQLAVDASEAPVSKKKKQTAEISKESDTEKPQVKPEDPFNIEDLTPEERRVFERKLKKERKKEQKKLQKEGLAVETKTEPAKPSAGELALQYLESWSNKSPEWKFQKARQTWLLMNMYDAEKVPAEHFKKLLPYLVGLKGSARETTIKKAEEYMKEYDNRETEEESDEQRTERIREVLQLLC